MTTIYFVRHAEVDNPANIAYGRMPGFHLNITGSAQAKKVASYFSKKAVVAIYTSPLERTFETANIISDSLPKSVPLKHVYDLIETDETGWEGLSWDKVVKNESYDLFINKADASVPGENINQMATRMFNVEMEICKKHQGQEVICVSHEFPILALKLKLEGKKLETIQHFNLALGSITKLVLDENCLLVESEYIEPK